MAKIFITGGNGQLGRACKRFFSKNHQVVTTDIQEMDITNSEKHLLLTLTLVQNLLDL